MRFIGLLPVAIVAMIASTHNVDADEPVCPVGMVLVDGEYCPVVKSECKDWMDKPDAIVRRCREYGPSSCAAATTHKTFCMDVSEYTEQRYAALQASSRAVGSVKQAVDPASRLPITKVDYYQAEALCKAEGNELCDEQQFEMACEGSAYNNYPVGQTRDCTKCNCDRTQDIGPDFDHRVDHRETIDEVAACRSGYGISGLVGNADEWYRRTKSYGPYISVLRGGHWLPIRARCTPDAATTGHGPLFSSLEVGFRCCHSL
jgi:formylglycine-generating enzyme required for sulfatase activity